MTILISMMVLHAGVVVDAHALRGVAQQISSAKHADPEAFAAVAQLRAQLPELDARKQGPLAELKPGLERLGARGLWPMLEMIAFDAAPKGALKDSAWLALQASLIEAAGALRDRRAAPVFEAVLRSDGQPFLVYRAAAEALGRLSDDATAAELIELSRGVGVKQDAILAGMGSSRRAVVAHALADALVAHPDEARAKNVIHGLSDVGNAWAWKTPAVTAKEEEVEVRDAAAKALVAAYAGYDGAVRQAASNALLVVDAPHTELLIENEKLRGIAVPELQQLEQRLKTNPVRQAF